MNKVDGQDTRNRLSAIVANSLDTQAKTQDLARQAYQSRTQFHRLFRTMVEETPAAMRRRLLLERAAYQLGHTGMSVTDSPWTPTTVRWRRSRARSGKLFGSLPASTGACVICTSTCRRPTKSTFLPLVRQWKFLNKRRK